MLIAASAPLSAAADPAGHHQQSTYPYTLQSNKIPTALEKMEETLPEAPASSTHLMASYRILLRNLRQTLTRPESRTSAGQ
jgi:hypothetical protein